MVENLGQKFGILPLAKRIRRLFREPIQCCASVGGPFPRALPWAVMFQPFGLISQVSFQISDRYMAYRFGLSGQCPGLRLDLCDDVTEVSAAQMFCLQK